MGKQMIEAQITGKKPRNHGLSGLLGLSHTVMRLMLVYTMPTFVKEKRQNVLLAGAVNVSGVMANLGYCADFKEHGPPKVWDQQEV